jgi:hypothetical protein
MNANHKRIVSEETVVGVSTTSPVRVLVQAGLAVEEVSAAGSGLEQLFLQLTEGAHV